MLRVDAVLAVLHRQGGGTRLLKTGDGGELVLARHGTTNRGFNDGRIHMTDANNQFGDTTVGDVNLRGYILHEIGHGWQGSAFVSGGTSYWTQFVAQSGWTSTNPNSPLYTLSTNEGRLKADGMTPDSRWYLTSAASNFASPYAQTNENEDFAESFAAFFTQRAGWTFYNGAAGAAAIPAKMTIFANWVAGL